MGVAIGLASLPLCYPGTAWAACDETVDTCQGLQAALAQDPASTKTVCLAAGSYGACSFIDVQRTGVATVVPDDGASISMTPHFEHASNITIDGAGGMLTLSDLQIDGKGDEPGTCSTHITVANFAMAANEPGILIDGHTCPGTPQHDVIDHAELIGVNLNGFEGIVSIRGGNTVQLTNSIIAGVGSVPGDGVQIVGGAEAITVGPGNVISEILQDNCGDTHCDAMQFYSPGDCGDVTITGNWFHHNSTFILNETPCRVTFVDNIVQDHGDFQAHCWRESLVAHNTFYNANFRPNGITDPVVVRDNIWDGSGGYDPDTVAGGGGGCPSGPCAGCSASHNLADGCTSAYGDACLSGAPTYLADASPPSTWDTWELADGSLGKNDASDGLDRGITYYGSSGPGSGSDGGESTGSGADDGGSSTSGSSTGVGTASSAADGSSSNGGTSAEAGSAAETGTGPSEAGSDGCSCSASVDGHRSAAGLAWAVLAFACGPTRRRR